ncbi:MAG: hypothetical protein V1810_02950 [Candidatus Beckwithbacteria bacterium]
MMNDVASEKGSKVPVGGEMTNPFAFLDNKNIRELTKQERNQAADILKKDNFGNKLQLPKFPEPGDKYYKLLEEIKAVYFTYETNKKADEEWMAAMRSDYPEVYGPALIHLEQMLGQVDAYKVGLKEARLIATTPENLAILNTVGEKNLEADKQFFSQGGEQKSQTEQMIDRVAMRLLRFDGVQFSLDFDKTLTKADDYLNNLPHAMQFENFMKKHGRGVLPYVMARYAREALLKLEDVYRTIGGTLEFRPGVEEFFEKTKALGIPLSIISANFRVIVTSCINQIPVEKRDHLLDIAGLQNTDVTAIDKEVVTARRVITRPNLANLLSIDGLSDEGCLQGVANGISAGIFVLGGTKFVEEVKKTGQPYFEFADFHDVNNIFKQILIRKEQLRS